MDSSTRDGYSNIQKCHQDRASPDDPLDVPVEHVIITDNNTATSVSLNGNISDIHMQDKEISMSLLSDGLKTDSSPEKCSDPLEQSDQPYMRNSEDNKSPSPSISTCKMTIQDQSDPIPVPPSVPKLGVSVLAHKLWIGNLDKRLTE